MRILLTTTVITLLLSVAAQAFDVWGFQSQISISHAKSVAAQRGYSYVIGGDDGKELFHTVGFYRDAAEGEAGIGYIGSFCDGRLIGITQFTKGTVGSFVDVLQDLRHVYGKPAIDMSSEMLADGRYRWLKLEFEPRLSDKVDVMIRTTPGSETAFRLSVSHGTGDGCSTH